MGDRKPTSNDRPTSFNPFSHALTAPTTPIKSLVTFASPFRTMRCQTCSHTTSYGTKSIDASRPPAPKKHLGIDTYLLHAKRPNCTAAIVLRTDPEDENRAIASGVTMGLVVG
jgi:hypothetical protein